MQEKFKEAIQTYDKIAKIYSDYTYQKLMQFQLSKFISLLKGGRVLDAGCGCGRDVEYFRNEGLDVVGVDVSSEMIKEAKKRVDGRFLVMDFGDLKFDEGSFDGIWCMAGFLHTARSEIVGILKEFYRVLADGGVVYIAVREGKGEQVIKKKKYDSEPRVYVYFSEDEFVGYLKEAGFEVLDSEVNKDGEKKWLEIFGRRV